MSKKGKLYVGLGILAVLLYIGADRTPNSLTPEQQAQLSLYCAENPKALSCR